MPIRKVLVAKRTKDYAIVKLTNGYSVILNAKFIRTKETDEFIYASFPYDYKINARQTAYDLEEKKFVITDEKEMFPRQVTWELHLIEVWLKSGSALEDITEYNNAVLPKDTEETPF